MPLAKVAVICAVWHSDALRHELLPGHQANLDHQTVPVERIYVFDDNDAPPPGLCGTVVTVSERLTIYQAWNVALSLVRSEYVMNLNLDDRLAPDAIEKLLAALESTPEAFLAGGDWHIRYTQRETDEVRPCFPLEELPFDPAWPPIADSVTRLGSGDALRGTLGPACMWRMAAHLRVPRYPWRFNDNSPIKTIGDTIWWFTISHRLKKKLLRVPLVIGNYLSHPDSQAEFRTAGTEENTKFCEIGCSLL